MDLGTGMSCLSILFESAFPEVRILKYTQKATHFLIRPLTYTPRIILPLLIFSYKITYFHYLYFSATS